MTDMNKIIDGLIQRTEDGTLKWKPGKSDEDFVLSVDSICVELRRIRSDGLTPYDRYRLALLNEGSPAATILETDDSFNSVPNDQAATSEQDLQLERLFTMARRSALDIQSALEKLAKALGTD